LPGIEAVPVNEFVRLDDSTSMPGSEYDTAFDVVPESPCSYCFPLRVAIETAYVVRVSGFKETDFLVSA
jgi:hypothetical protein